MKNSLLAAVVATDSPLLRRNLTVIGNLVPVPLSYETMRCEVADYRGGLQRVVRQSMRFEDNEIEARLLQLRSVRK